MTTRDTAIKSTLAMVAEIDQAELATRLIEVGCHLHRPVGMTGRKAWANTLRLRDEGKIPAYIVDDFWMMAEVAIRYMAECVKAGKAPQ